MTEQGARILLIISVPNGHRPITLWSYPRPDAGDVALSGGTAESLPDTIEHRRKESGRDERRRAHGVSGRSRPLSAGPDDRIDGHGRNRTKQNGMEE
jgi:hypothetical protein